METVKLNPELQANGRKYIISPESKFLLQISEKEAKLLGKGVYTTIGGNLYIAVINPAKGLDKDNLLTMSEL